VFALSAAVLCGSASAAQFTVGTADSNSAQPSVALDQHGNAWVTWTAEPVPQTTMAVNVCEIPAGTQACGPVQQVATYPWISTTQFRSSIFFDAPHQALDLVIGIDLASNDQLQVSRSVWNGSAYPSFPPPVQVGNVDPARGAAAIDPGDGLVLAISDVNEALYAQGAALNETAPGETSQATLVNLSGGANIIYGSAISFDGQHLVAAWGSGLYPPGGPRSGGPISYGYISSSSLTPSLVNTTGNWKEGSLDDGGTSPTLAGGPAGTFLAETVPGSSTGFLDLRTFTGSGFAPASPVYCGDASTYGAGVQSDPALAEDQTGRLHLAYIASGTGGEDLRYVTLAGANQSAPETLAHNTSGSDLWENPGVSGNSTSAVAVWIGDISDNVFASWLPGAMPATSGCPLASTSATVGGLTVTVKSPAPSACLANSKRLNVSLSTSGKHAKVKFKSAQFFIDKGVKHIKKKHGKKVIVYLPNATAHHVPAVLQIPISGLHAGTHTLNVKLTLSQKIKGKTHLIHKTLHAHFTVC
jgi:hypothetical protein